MRNWRRRARPSGWCRAATASRWQDYVASPSSTASAHAIARDAAELLIGDPRRIKRCPNHECLWLFYDASKNLSRRWCAMDDCGTLDKVRRFRGRAS